MSLPIRLRHALALAAMLFCAGANAQLFRAYLSVNGSDANNCTVAAPCRLLPAALAAVADGGEIWMLDSANYNTSTVNIAKSVTILAVPGALGSVVAIGGGSAISISTAGIAVTLRNLVITLFPGTSGLFNGVTLNGASFLSIEGSVVANMPGNGVSVLNGGNLKVTNSVLRQNAAIGILLIDGSRAEISGTKIIVAQGGGGVTAETGAASTTTTIALSDSVISGPGATSSATGVTAVAPIAGAVASVYVARCTIEDTGTALSSNAAGVGTASITIANNHIANNFNAWATGTVGASIVSLGNNDIVGYTGTSGPLTTIPQL